MRRLYLIITLIILSVNSFAAINSQYDFENGVPNFVKTNDKGEVTASAERFKDGSSSLKFSWKEGGELTFRNYLDLEPSMKVNGAGMMMWIYNTEAYDEPLKITYWDWNDHEICHFYFNMNHTGWRTIWMKYIDMLTPDGHYGDKKPAERNTAVAKMTITPPACAKSGTIYIDRVSFPKKKLHDQITPDMQIPENNYNLKRNMWQWCRLWEWEQYPALPAEALTDAQKEMVRLVTERLDKWASEDNPSPDYTKNTLLKRADDYFSKYNIKRLPDGTMSGAPLLSDDEFNNSLGEMRIRFIGDIVFYYALDYLYTGNKDNIPRVVEALDHALEQGWAYGSGQGTNHHFGYQVRDLYKGFWLLRNELKAYPHYDEYVKTLTYWSGLAEVRKPYQYHRDEILDTWHTIQNAKVFSAMLQDEADAYAYMKALGSWLSSSMMFTDGTLGGFKIDGTSFHHGGHYPAYTTGAVAALGEFCLFTRGTDFIPDEEARRCMKKCLLTMQNYTMNREWGFAIAGRHPFAGNIPNADVEAYGRVAVLGDLSGSGRSIDPELAGAYLALGGKNKELVAAIKKEGISPYEPDEGFYVYNYGAFGIHRRGDWMLTLKGYNSDVWGSEIYAADNRYGRYLSYGTVQFITSNGPKKDGYNQEGWDWNRLPGATAIHLPFEKLDSPLPGTLMEKNTSRFPGVSSLEGRNGVLAFTCTEKDRVNFCKGATVTKSVFCFDNRIVFLGTGITNDSNYPTETTLYQLRLDDKEKEVIINDDIYTEGFPFSYRHREKGRTTLTDPFGNYYFLADGYNLVVEKKSQTSNSDTKKKVGTGDFITAYIDHESAPRDASYEYMMYVRPNKKELKAAKKAMPYKVLQADNKAHVVMDTPTGITAYVSYGGYEGSGTHVIQIGKETIVMERGKEDGSIVMSICTPDLGFEKKVYTTDEIAGDVMRSIVLDGNYELLSENAAVSLVNEGGKTIISAACRNGQPVEFNLRTK